MSSPAETVNGLMQWLSTTLGVTLPVLPFSGIWRRVESLWLKLIATTFPTYLLPLPWIFDVEGPWQDLFPGAPVELQNLQILVSERPPIESPTLPPHKSSKR
jgi:hypothetical protein